MVKAKATRRASEREGGGEREARFHSYQPVYAAEGREECFKSRTVFMQFVDRLRLTFSQFVL